MNYPEPLKKGDTIGICAPSSGVTEERKREKLDLAIKQLHELGYQVIETPGVRCGQKGRSTPAKQRAKELMDLLENDQVKLILFAAASDFLVELLDELNWEKLKTIKPKWLQGYSDITGLSFVFTTKLGIPTIYSETAKAYAMKPLFKSLTDALALASGEEITQTSFSHYENREAEENEELTAPYQLTEPVEWKNITGQEKIVMQGRLLGGCLDVIQYLIGTRYDEIENYIKTYQNDGIIWFFDCFEVSTPNLFYWLWQMKNAGYFEHCRGIIFGRPLMVREDCGITFSETILDAVGKLGIPIIIDADIGHVSPQLAMVNGAKAIITSEKGQGKVQMYFK